MNRRVRFAVLERDNFQCRYCGRPAGVVTLEVDHIHPRSRGGDSSLDNLVTACHDCNQGKKHYLLGQRALAVIDEPYDSDDIEIHTRYVLAGEAFTEALVDAYARGMRDAALRFDKRPTPSEEHIRDLLYWLGSKSQQIQ